MGINSVENAIHGISTVLNVLASCLAKDCFIIGAQFINIVFLPTQYLKSVLNVLTMRGIMYFNTCSSLNC